MHHLDYVLPALKADRAKRASEAAGRASADWNNARLGNRPDAYLFTRFRDPAWGKESCAVTMQVHHYQDRGTK